MDAFNVVAGVITILAAAFSVYVFADTRRKAAVEEQRADEYRRRLADVANLARAVGQQVTLMATVSDRDDVTKKELKHLAISQLSTVSALQGSIDNMREVAQHRKFGIPDHYQNIPQVPSAATRATEV